MKKIVVIAAAMGICFTQINAQSFIKKITDNLSGGFIAEANMSNFIIADLPDVKSNMNIGSTLGGFVKLNITEHFAIQEDVLVQYKTSTLEQNGFKSDYQYWGIEVPIYALGQWKLNNGNRFYVGVGPCVEYGFSAKNKIGGAEFNLYEKDKITDKAPFTQLVVSAGTIVGYEFSSGIQLNAGYKIGITNTLDAGKDDSSMRPSTISLGIGYRF